MGSLASVAALLAISGCMDLEAPGGETIDEKEYAACVGANCSGGTDACDPTDPDFVPTRWCGWHNGFEMGWYNAWQNDHQFGWQMPWRNGLENGSGASAQTAWANSWSGAWSNMWSGNWASWDFNPASWAWTMNESNGCAHPTTLIGGALASTCNNVVSQVCAGSPACCTGSWTQACVNSAVAIGDDSIAEPHSLLQWGSGLRATDQVVIVGGSMGKAAPSGSEAPAATGSAPHGGLVFHPPWVGTNNCVAEVCKAGSGFESCCGSGPFAWNYSCMQRAVNLCTSRYLTNNRIEDGRLVVDACVETKISGFPACPLAPTQTAQGTGCCQRALVLQGVYRAVDPITTVDTSDDGKGRPVNWSLFAWARLGFSFMTTRITATLVPDQCVTMADGSRSCKVGDTHKLWRTAGPPGPIYPDCVAAPTSATVAGAPVCNCATGAKEMCADTTHYGVGLRGALLATLSALITTDAPHDLNVRWAMGGSPSTPAPFPYDSTASQVADLRPREALWTSHGRPGVDGDANFYYDAEAGCYSPHSPQRRAGLALVAHVPSCPDPSPNWNPPMLTVDEVGPLSASVYSFFGELLAYPD
jgi:hypothetical protein